MANVLGLNGKAYRNTNTGSDANATPYWDLMDNITDVTLNLSKETADVTVRGGSGYTLRVATLKDFTVSFQMIYDTTNTDYTTLEDAFLNDTVLQYAFCDGEIATTGTQGFKAFCYVTNFSRSEALRDAFRVDVELSAAYYTESGSIVPPTDFTIA